MNWTKIAIMAAAKGLAFGIKSLRKPQPLKLREQAAGEEIVALWPTQFRNAESWLDFPPGQLILSTHRIAFLRQGNHGSTKELHFPLQHVSQVAPFVARFSSGVEFASNGRTYHFAVRDREAVSQALREACERLPAPDARLELQPKKSAWGCFGVVLVGALGGGVASGLWVSS